MLGRSITTTIDFELPTCARNHPRRQVLVLIAHHSHADHAQSMPHRRGCRWNLFRWLPFGPELLKFVFAKFVEQDRRTMELQSKA